MPRTKEQFEEIRLEKIKTIKEVALRIFANEGYFQASIAKIAQAANISKGLLYNYFESKEELLKAIVFDAIDEIYESFDQNHDGVLTADEFEFFVRHTFELQKQRREFYKMYYSLVIQPEILKIVDHKMAEKGAVVMKVMMEYFIRNFSEPQTEMLLFSSMVKGLGMQYVFAPEQFTGDLLEQAINKIIELYKR